MIPRIERVGALDVCIAGGTDGRGGGDGPVVVLLHGFGAPGTDLVPLHEVIDTPREVRWAFPAAPLALPGLFAPGRAWWMIDLERLQHDLSAPDPGARARDRAGELPEGLEEVSAAVSDTVDGLRELLSIGDAPLVLGGFSQGAMLACDVALCGDQALAGLVVMSGTLIAADRWRAAAPSRAGLPVFQSHGEADPLLPFEGAVGLRELLAAGGLPVSWLRFPGGHEIPPTALDGIADFLAGVFSR